MAKMSHDDNSDTQTGTESTESAEAQQSSQGTGPIGQGDYVVRQGDCISSIARNTGHFWETIWNEPANAELKAARENPNVLLPEDRLTIPELRRKEEAGSTEQRHRFRRKGEPAKLRLQLLKQPDDEEDEQDDEDDRVTSSGSDPNDCVVEEQTEDTPLREDEPRANVPYTLIIDGEQRSGTTDEEGRIEEPIPGNARAGKLILNPGTDQEETIKLRLGGISPITEIRGVKERLGNLDLECGEGDEETAELEAALRQFQRKHGLEVTGRADQPTRDKLVEVHGC